MTLMRTIAPESFVEFKRWMRACWCLAVSDTNRAPTFMAVRTKLSGLRHVGPEAPF